MRQTLFFICQTVSHNALQNIIFQSQIQPLLHVLNASFLVNNAHLLLQTVQNVSLPLSLTQQHMDQTLTKY